MMRTRLALFLLVGFTASANGHVSAQAPAPPPRPSLAERARQVLAQQDGTIMLAGITAPVEVLRDRWGTPHIYASSTADLFFAQGFVAAQDRMWQLEMWRRNGEGRLAEVLGPDYVTRDRFARLIAFRGNWDEEFRRYHPEGQLIFDSFARGVNAAIQQALAEDKVPVEFDLVGFRPQPVWTARTLLTRMPGWTLTRNASSEVLRALDIKAMGLARAQELRPTDPVKALEIPEGLDLEDIDAEILAITRGANNLQYPVSAELGSNNWVVGGSKSATGKPILANDPHREVVNPSLRYTVHLNAPGWNAIGGTEPGLPGISIGHNDRIAWGFTILGMDQQDLYVEETHAERPDTYLADGTWLDMDVRRELIYVKGRTDPVEVDLKYTRHGPVLHENTARHRAFALRWVGAEAGGAGYLGSINVMQASNWQEFNDALPKAWFIPSHSLVYADVDGNYGYVGVAQTPIRRNWDGLLPVPGKDSRYEWQGFVPYNTLPKSLNAPRGFYNSSNNDVVPKIVPGYPIQLGWEYSSPYRYERIFEVLHQKKTFTVADMEALQQDTLSIPARELVPLLKGLPTPDAELRWALDLLLGWNFVLDRESIAATVYEFWVNALQPRAYAPRVPPSAQAAFARPGRPAPYDMDEVIRWMKTPDAAYGADARTRRATRDRILLEALVAGLADLKRRVGEDRATWKWGDVHTADLVHTLGRTDRTRALFQIPPVKRGGDAFTPQAATSVSDANVKQQSGASFMFVMDTSDWDHSTALNTPGNSAQPGSPHYSDLAPLWGAGTYFPLAFSRKNVEALTTHRLVLYPVREPRTTGEDAGAPRFEPVQPELFSAPGAQTSSWGDVDADGDLDLYVGFRGQASRLYRNDRGTFVNVAAKVGLADFDEVRASAWGDYDGDGDLDLYVGYARPSPVRNRLYRNEGRGARFTDVARAAGVDVYGTTRQPAFVDVDNDGDLDLFVAFRDRPNMLFRNDGGRFIDVAAELGVADARKTVGAAWFDMDQDGDLDLFVANQDGDTDGFYRNDGERFVDVAPALGMDGHGRSRLFGGVGPAVADFDNDGDLDLFVANYGPNVLWRNDGMGRFTNVAPEMGVAGDYHATTSAWGDVDNDGWVDLYVGTYLANVPNFRDYLYRNLAGQGFADVLPRIVARNDATHGVQWADVDQDGALDLAVADNGPAGTHFLFRNLLPAAAARRSVSILVLDDRGHYTRAGAEVRVYAAGTSRLLGTRLVDTGSGYCSQSAGPVHVGLPDDPAAATVDIEVTFLTPAGRQKARVTGVRPSGTPIVVRPGSPASREDCPPLRASSAQSIAAFRIAPRGPMRRPTLPDATVLEKAPACAGPRPTAVS